MPETTPLSPAESLFLLELKYSSRQAMKVTLLELLAQKVIRIDTRERRGVLRTQQVQFLRILTPRVPNAPAHVASLMNTLTSGHPGGLDMDGVTKLLLNKY